jgi:PAB-dependent poly(A)-specific ribonuclease subunit 2
VYSGLETDILNSYTNPLLQALHYTPLRTVAKAHICIDCEKEHCLLCEAGFLFRMLEDAKGTNCQATNFCRAFGATTQGESRGGRADAATALGLMDDESGLPYGTMIQSLNRWLLSTFSSESAVASYALRGLDALALESTSPVDQVLGVKTRTTSTCTGCAAETSRQTTMQVIDLQYRRNVQESFCEVLQASLLRESDTKATCTMCKRFIRIESRRALAADTNAALPAALCVNAMAADDAWRGRYLPARLSVDEHVGVSEKGEGIVYHVKVSKG